VKFETLEYFFERGRLADVLPASFARFAAPIVVETETLQHGELVGKDELTEHVRGNPDGFLGFPKPPEMFWASSRLREKASRSTAMERK
jgi:hypothetical protein